MPEPLTATDAIKLLRSRLKDTLCLGCGSLQCPYSEVYIKGFDPKPCALHRRIEEVLLETEPLEGF